MIKGGSSITLFSFPSALWSGCLRPRTMIELRGSRLPFHPGLPLILIMMMAMFGCQRSYLYPSPPATEAAGKGRLSRLTALEDSLKGMQGVADLEISTLDGAYRGKAIFCLELPDRSRFESLNFLGFPDWVLSSDGETIQLYLPSQRKIIQGASNPENLARMFGAKIPIFCVLRILMGEIPLPVNDRSGSWIFLGKSGEFFLEGEASLPVLQRLWVDGATGTLKRGEIVDEGGAWLSFQCGDYREIDGFLVPFRLRIHLERSGVRLQLIHRELQINPSFPADTFRLALPWKDDIRLLNLEEMGVIEDWQR